MNSGGCAMSERRSDIISMYRAGRNDRLSSTAASLGLLEPFESEDWNVEWPRLRSSDVSSLTVQTLIAQPSVAATSVRSEFLKGLAQFGRRGWRNLARSRPCVTWILC